MAYIDGDYLDDAFGATNVLALTATSAERDLLIAQAQSVTHAALLVAGYDNCAPGDYDSTGSNCPDAIRLAAYGEWLRLACSRHNKQAPQITAIQYVALIRDGLLEIPDLTKVATRAIGGVVKTDTTSTAADGGRAAVFTRAKMEGYG